jgi:hypothetical protein
VALHLSEPVLTDGDLHFVLGYFFILFLCPNNHQLYPRSYPNMSILNDVFRLLFGPTEAFKLTRISLAPPTPQGPSTPVATLGFDPDQELLWAGNEYVSPVNGDNASRSLITLGSD